MKHGANSVIVIEKDILERGEIDPHRVYHHQRVIQ
jgi:hypothetical protein